MRSSVPSASGESGFTAQERFASRIILRVVRFADPVGTFLKAFRPRFPAMLTLPMQPPPQQFGALFDADTRAAIASGLCISCRGAKLLCGKSRCPIMVRWDSMMKTAPMIDRVDLDGSSPPGVFVGRFGYPKVFVGPLVPPVHGDTQILDSPEEWVGLPMDDIVGFRSQLVRGMHRVHVRDVERGGRLVDSTRELALATSPAEVEAGFSRKPRGRVILDDNVQPFGPSAPLTRLDVGTLKVDSVLDRAYSDTDLKARDAVLELFDRRVPISQIQRAFSVGGHRRLLLRRAPRGRGGVDPGAPAGRDGHPSRDASRIHHANRRLECPRAGAGGPSPPPCRLRHDGRDPFPSPDAAGHPDG